MSEDQALIKEVEEYFEEEQRLRAADIEAAKKHDEELLRKREAGEYGVSRGTDLIASQLMFVVATLATIGLIWMVFNMDPR